MYSYTNRLNLTSHIHICNFFANIFPASQNNVCKKTEKSFKIWHETKQNEMAKILCVFWFRLYFVRSLSCYMHWFRSNVFFFFRNSSDAAKNNLERYFFHCFSVEYFQELSHFANDIWILFQSTDHRWEQIAISIVHCRKCWFYWIEMHKWNISLSNLQARIQKMWQNFSKKKKSIVLYSGSQSQ